MIKLTDRLVKYFKRPESETKIETPEGICPVCWGYQEYDHKVRMLFKDKQIDVKNHQTTYLIIKDFVVNHIDGIKLREGKVKKCPTCGYENNNGETSE
jgi:hypothetical protein